MTNQFTDGYFRIVSLSSGGGTELIGVPYLGPPHLPVLQGRAESVRLNMWQFKYVEDGTYELGVYDFDQRGYPFTGVLHDEYVIGTVRPEEISRWRFVRQPVALDSFTIESVDKPGFGWTVGGHGGRDVVLAELPSGDDLQPVQLFRIQPF